MVIDVGDYVIRTDHNYGKNLHTLSDLKEKVTPLPLPLHVCNFDLKSHFVRNLARSPNIDW